MEEIRDMRYCYKGANCAYIRFRTDTYGYVTALNDYSETIYKGPEDRFAQFVGELTMNKWA
jgi:hypothetical protein